MKPDFIRILIALGLTALAVWAIVAFSPYGQARLPLGIGSGLTFGLGMVLLIGFRTTTRTMVSARVAGTLYVIFAFACNLVFAFFDFSLPLYVIVNGVPLLLFLLLWSSLSRASKDVG